MSRFMGDNVTVTLSGGDTVEVINSLSDEDYGKITEEFIACGEDTTKILQVSRRFLSMTLRGWNFKGNEDIPCTPENIAKLTSTTVFALTKEIQALYLPEQKKNDGDKSSNNSKK